MLAGLREKVLLRNADFWQRYARESFTDRQKTVLNRYLDGFQGKLTAKKWAALAQVSIPSAQRDDCVGIGGRKCEPHFASATHFKVASQRSCPRCMSVASLLRSPAASFPTPASSITTWHMAPRGSRYQE